MPGAAGGAGAAARGAGLGLFAISHFSRRGDTSASRRVDPRRSLTAATRAPRRENGPAHTRPFGESYIDRFYPHSNLPADYIVEEKPEWTTTWQELVDTGDRLVSCCCGQFDVQKARLHRKMLYWDTLFSVLMALVLLAPGIVGLASLREPLFHRVSFSPNNNSIITNSNSLYNDAALFVRPTSHGDLELRVCNGTVPFRCIPCDEKKFGNARGKYAYLLDPDNPEKGNVTAPAQCRCDSELFWDRCPLERLSHEKEVEELKHAAKMIWISSVAFSSCTMVGGVVFLIVLVMSTCCCRPVPDCLRRCCVTLECLPCCCGWIDDGFGIDGKYLRAVSARVVLIFVNGFCLLLQLGCAIAVLVFVGNITNVGGESSDSGNGNNNSTVTQQQQQQQTTRLKLLPLEPSGFVPVAAHTVWKAAVGGIVLNLLALLLKFLIHRYITKTMYPEPWSCGAYTPKINANDPDHGPKLYGDDDICPMRQVQNAKSYLYASSTNNRPAQVERNCRRICVPYEPDADEIMENRTLELTRVEHQLLLNLPNNNNHTNNNTYVPPAPVTEDGSPATHYIVNGVPIPVEAAANGGVLPPGATPVRIGGAATATAERDARFGTVVGLEPEAYQNAAPAAGSSAATGRTASFSVPSAAPIENGEVVLLMAAHGGDP